MIKQTLLAGAMALALTSVATVAPTSAEAHQGSWRGDGQNLNSGLPVRRTYKAGTYDVARYLPFIVTNGGRPACSI